MISRLLPAGADLISHIADELAAEPAAGTHDLAGTLVVFPGKRPGYFLLRAIADRLNTGFVPPRVVSMDEMVDEIHRARRPEARPDLEGIDAVALLFEIQREASRPLGGSAFLSLDTFFPVGLKIFSDLEELRIEGIEPRRVEEVQPLIDEGIPPQSRESLQTMRRFYEEFYPRVERQGFATRSSRYWEVCTTITAADAAAYSRIIVAGFFALTRAERTLFAGLGSRPGVSFLFQDGAGMKEKLAGMGITAAPVRAGSGSPGAAAPARPRSVQLYQSPDSHGQVFALSALLESPDQRTVIVLPSAESLFPLQRHCLSRLGRDAYNISLGYPLVRTPVYGFLNDLMELIGSMDEERVYVPRYLTFMLHPYTKNTLFRGSAAATRVLLHALEESLTRERTRMFATLSEIEGDDAIFEQAALGVSSDGVPADAEALRAHLRAIHAATLGRFRSFSTVRAFAEQCIDLLVWVHDSTTAADHPYFSPFAESFIEALHAISRSLIRDASFLDHRSYFTLLRRYLEGRYQRFPGTPLQGLQVLGSLETRNLSFDRVFILDAVEGTFPQAGPEDSLLPFPVRAALGLSTRKAREQMEAYYFSLLASGARELSLFFIDNGAREKSRFVERLLWEQQKQDRVVDARPYVRAIRYRVNLENLPPSAVPKSEELVRLLSARRFSASALGAYLRCPLSFYYGRVLGLSQRKEVTGDHEPADIGILVHDILAEYFRPTVGRRMEDRDLDPNVMDEVAARQFEAKYGPSDTGANRLLRVQLQKHLREFLSGYMRPLLGEAAVTNLALEKQVVMEWQGFSLTGRMDAVQRRGDRTVVIDYKTGHGAKGYAIDFRKLDVADRSTWGTAI
ncbi:MAG TPA: PD-(D/E)XK nuclease family protein, partial [Spirochaetia bacterium]|nr:PD-(D/E)XK nuclease family protein [Spirochaetia bacterium]